MTYRPPHDVNSSRFQLISGNRPLVANHPFADPHQTRRHNSLWSDGLLCGCLLFSLLSLLLGSPAWSQTTWCHVQKQIQALDEQLDGFASRQLSDPDQVLIDRAKIRVRVIARDLLATGAMGEDDGAITSILYGSTFMAGLKTLDQLFEQLPHPALWKKEGKTLTPQQRRKYLLMKPALARFARHPIRRLALTVTYPGQIRGRVARAISPLLDVLDAAGEPPTQSTWHLQTPVPSEHELMELGRLSGNRHLKRIVAALRPALGLEQYKPQIAAIYQQLQDLMVLKQRLTSDTAQFMRARPLFLTHMETALQKFMDPAQRVNSQIQIQQLLTFSDSIRDIETLNQALIDTQAMQDLLATAVEIQDDNLRNHLVTWIQGWVHLRMAWRITPPPRSDILRKAYQNTMRQMDSVLKQIEQNSHALQARPSLVLSESYRASLRQLQQAAADCAMYKQLDHQLRSDVLKNTDLQKIINNLITQSAFSMDSGKIQLVRDFYHQAQVVLKLAGKIPGSPVFAGVPDQALWIDQIEKRTQQWIEAWTHQRITEAEGYFAGVSDLLHYQSLLGQTADLMIRERFNALAMLQLNPQALQMAMRHLRVELDDAMQAMLTGESQSLVERIRHIRQHVPYVLVLLEVLLRQTPLLRVLPPQKTASLLLSELAWPVAPTEHDPKQTADFARLCVLLNEWYCPSLRNNARKRRNLLTQCQKVGLRILLRQKYPQPVF